MNAFVGGMVGLERTVVPLVGSEEFRLSSATVIASFIASFGIAKAFTNLVSGQLADSWGRKPVLVLGWAVGLPALHDHRGNELELDRRRQCSARN